MLQQTTSIVFACEHGFKPYGVAKLWEEMANELPKNGIDPRHVQVTYNYKEDCFEVDCSSSARPAIAQLFLSVLQSMITAEKKAGGLIIKPDDLSSYSEDSSDDDDSDCGSDSDSDFVARNAKYLEHSKSIFCRSSGQQKAPNVQVSTVIDALEIVDETPEYRKTLTYNGADKNLDQVIPNETVIDVEILTGAKLERDLNEQKIYISSSDEKSCLSAYNKLCNLQEYFDVPLPYVDHVFYTEATGNYQLAIIPIVDVKKKRYETTLFNIHPTNEPRLEKIRYNTLHNGLVALCCSFDHKRAIYDLDKLDKLIPGLPDPAVVASSIGGWSSTFKFSGQANHQGKQVPQWEQGFGGIDETKTRADRTGASESLEVQSTVPEAPIHIKEWVDSITGPLPTDQQSSVHSIRQIQALHNSTNSRPASGFNEPQVHTNNAFAIPGFGPANPSHSKSFAQVPPNKTNSDNSAYAQAAQQVSLTLHANGVQESNPLNPKASQVLPPTQRASLASHGPTAQAQNVTTAAPQQTMSYSTAVRGSKLSHVSFPSWPDSRPRSVPQSGNTHNFAVRSENMNGVWPTPAATITTTTATSTTTTTRVPGQAPATNAGAAMINPQQNPTATGSALRAQDDVLGDQLVEFFSPLRSQDHLMMPEIQPLTPTRVSGDRSAMTTREQDRLQRVSEVATRTFHSTMDQKKPRPSTSTTKTTLKQKATAHLERPDDVPRQVSTFSAHVDPLPEFSRTTENSIYNMLERLRGFQGELTVNAELGRIIMRKLKTRDITEKKSTPRTITAEDLHRDLLATKHDPRDGPFIRFTNILTTLPADIDLLVAMQDSDRYDLWNKQPATWDVVYELDCTVVEHGIKTPFTIKIDAEKFTYTLVKKLDLAAIFIHCVKRNWDVQVTATGSVPMSMYDEHVLPILDTLYAKQGTQPYLEFTSSCSNLLTIHTGRVRRSCQYAAQGKFKSRLNVTQIQELSIEYDQAIEGIQNFRAFYPDPSHRRQPGEEGTWFEVNVSSTVLEEHLKENMQIEFGDKTSWDVQKLMADNVASAIIEPALLMVQRADGVGFWNNNLQQKPVSQPAQATPPVKPRGYQFW